MAETKPATTKPTEQPEGIPPWKEPPGSMPEPQRVTEPPAHFDIPAWQEPPADPDHDTVQVLTGEFQGRDMRFPKDVAAQAIADGWAKKHGDPDPQLDQEAQMKARHASHEAIGKLRNPKRKDEATTKPAHQTREMQAAKTEELYRTRQATPPPKR